MKRFFLFFRVFSCLCIFCAAVPAKADDSLADLKGEMQAMKEQFNDMQAQHEAKMQAMQDRIEELEAKPAPQAPQPSGLERALSNMNPQISVIGDVVYHMTDEDGEELNNDFSFREVELAFSANVDNYARGDFSVAIENEDGETHAALEEGYLTLLETPIDNLQGKFGKFRPFFGKANRMHLHSMPWTTYPKVVENFLGEEGFSEVGASLSYLLPAPGDIFSELTFEAFNNNNSNVLGAGEGGEVVYLGHWKNFLELGDTSSLEIGGSYMFGENAAEDAGETKVSGVDVTFNTNLLENLRTTSHTEAFFSKKEIIDSDDADAWGMFSSLEQQLSPRWSTFYRYDLSQLPASSETETTSHSGGLTFAQSEYAFWRVMFTHNDNTMSEDSNEVWLQLNFGIGPHRAHSYR